MRGRLELVEQSARSFALEEIEPSFAATAWRRYNKYLDIEFPSPKTDYLWRFRAKGWIGYLPIDKDAGIRISSKIPIANTLAMLEESSVYTALRFLPGREHCASFEELYSAIVRELANRAMRRASIGLHRAYTAVEEVGSYVRGRLSASDLARRPWATTFKSEFEVQTQDNEENQIVAWALYLASRSPLPEATQTLAKNAFRTFSSSVSLIRYDSATCLRRRYHDLTRDYEALHILAAFVIEGTGPQQAHGEHLALPFVVDMARVFEQFVAALLRRLAEAHTQYTVVAQERIRVGPQAAFILDFLLRDSTGAPVVVIDTKYKNADTPDADDVAQIVAYATAARVTEAVLVYPLPIRWSAEIGNVRLRAVGLPLDSAIEDCREIVAREFFQRAPRLGG